MSPSTTTRINKRSGALVFIGCAAALSLMQCALALTAESAQIVSHSGGSGSSSSSEQQSTISHGASGRPKSTLTSEPADSIAALMESNFLDSPQSSQQQQQRGAVSATSDDSISDSINSIQTFKSSLGKTRRQAEQKAKSVDWWSKLAHKHSKRAQEHERKGGAAGRSHAPRGPPPVYREQPLGQNPLVTMRHQLLAIRDKHRLLLQRSVPQLMQLDAKLVDSYKLCLRRKMPLYAGMLYRTRDHVVRMANEVKHERQVLEAMTKQIQKVLRHKMANRTLVKEYNQASAGMSGSSTSGNLISALDLSVPLKPLQQLDYAELASNSAPSATNGGAGGSSADAAVATGRTKRAAAGASALSSARSGSDSRGSAGRVSLSKRSDNSQLSLNEQQQQQPIYDLLKTRHAPQSSSSSSSVPQSKTRLTLNALDGEDQLNREVFSTEGADDFGILSTSEIAFSGAATTPTTTTTSTTTPTTTTTTTTTTRRPRPSSYTVHINEVNLKRELVKSQALIDRVNVSSHELMSVADDIIYLFKLTSGDLNPRKGLSASGKTNRFDVLDQKRVKKVMLKSPFKTLLERYGKLSMGKPGAGGASMASTQAPGSATTLNDNVPFTRSTLANDINMMTTSSFLDINTINPPEMRPLFDANEAAVYKDPADLELGFDTPATLEI